ncbi:MAG: hypothetical protein H7A29_07055 [Thermotogae bacterium]|nr:hypothetical protein [Thermotogota bacterium]
MVKLTDESSKEAFIDYCRKFIRSMAILFLLSETFVAAEDHPSVILLNPKFPKSLTMKTL